LIAWIEPLPTTSACDAVPDTHLMIGRSGARLWDTLTDGPDGANPLAVVTDGTSVYWLAQDEATCTYDLVSLDLESPTRKPTFLATGIEQANALDVDGTYVYFTSTTHQGSVLYLLKDQPDTPHLLAQGRNTTSDPLSTPYGINAADPTRVYWLVSAAAGTVERTSKPSPP
jgi:hypothetical protein